MSGETENQVSAWTIDSLHEHMNKLIAESDRRYEQRFEAQEKAVQAALVAAEKAVTKAEVAAEKRFDNVNEFRAQLADQASTFMPRLEAENRIAQNVEKIESLVVRYNTDLGIVNSRLDTRDGKSSGLDTGWGYLVGAAGFVAIVISIVLSIT